MAQQVWYGLLDADRQARYFQRLSDKFRWRNRIILLVLFVSASGAATNLLASGPEIASGLIFLATAAASVWLYLADYSGKAAASRLFSNQYSELAAEWKRLWYEGETPEEVHALQRRQISVASGYTISVDHDLNEKCAGETYAVLKAEFNA